MHKLILGLIFGLFLLAAPGARAAERKFDFSDFPLDQTPTGCVSTVTGIGKPGTWKLISDEVPVTLQMFNTAPMTARKSVVAQLATDYTDEHFPLLILTNEIYGDFTFTTRFKTVSGVIEQMAGIAFRLQNESNFYVLRASTLGNNIRFYKVVNGVRSSPIGPDLEVRKGVWHELSVTCKGNQIACSLDGKQEIPTLTDNDFSSGRIAYWTKSDSVSYFTDTWIRYTLREPLAQTWVHDLMASYPQLLGLQIIMLPAKAAEPRLVASDKAAEIGQPGRKSDADVIGTGTIYYDLQPDSVVVAMPLRDRNGEPQASVRIKMKPFKGQTEKTAIERAVTILKKLQARVPASDDWIE